MARPIIEIEGLGKKYRIRGQRERYLSLRDEIGKKLTSVFRPRSSVAGRKEDFWALKDVSFSVNEGGAVGIIGRNGAGKSTILKVLTKITPPTEGNITLRGRVASLLEIGTGFHPEMTGRENIYLNGAVLGMTRAEVRRKFDEIVAFAEVESFLETPVKRYSSGMYVRLAFAVAAHLEPEILLVDEVLAVGDAEFQKKCLGKMGDVARGGRTVLFVSHNMGAIQQLCPTSIWLDGGRIADAGPSPRIVAAYLKSGYAPTNPSETVFPENPGKEAQLLRARVLNHEGIVTSKLSCSEPVILDLDFQVRESTPGLYGYLELMRTDGLRFLISYSQDVVPDPLASLRQGRYSIRIAIPPLVLGSGEYSVYLNFQSRTASKFYVDSPGFVCGFVLDDSASGPGGNRPALLSTRLPWSIRQIAEGRAA